MTPTSPGRFRARAPSPPSPPPRAPPSANTSNVPRTFPRPTRRPTTSSAAWAWRRRPPRDFHARPREAAARDPPRNTRRRVDRRRSTGWVQPPASGAVDTGCEATRVCARRRRDGRRDLARGDCRDRPICSRARAGAASGRRPRRARDIRIATSRACSTVPSSANTRPEWRRRT